MHGLRHCTHELLSPLPLVGMQVVEVATGAVLHTLPGVSGELVGL